MSCTTGTARPTTSTSDIIPIDVLDYVIARRGAEPLDPIVLAILLDYYFLHLLSLLSLRIWDEGDADANLDRLERRCSSSCRVRTAADSASSTMPKR